MCFGFFASDFVPSDSFWLGLYYNLYPILRRNCLRFWMSFSVSTPLGLYPSITPIMPLPCSVSATMTCTGFAVVQKTEHTSGHALMEFNTFTGNDSLMRITNIWPAAMLPAFRIAISLRVLSFPSDLTRHGPEASQNAMPNFIPGTALTMTSYKSSAVLIKWVCPMMILAPSGISIVTALISIVVYL